MSHDKWNSERGCGHEQSEEDIVPAQHSNLSGRRVGVRSRADLEQPPEGKEAEAACEYEVHDEI